MSYLLGNRNWKLGDQHRAFTLVELLVTLAIMAVLIAILLPLVVAARAREQMTLCENNVRTLLVALNSYAAATNGEYPPNFASPAPGQYWHDQKRIGQFLQCAAGSDGSLIGGVMICPSDPNAQRSYAMNIWASSKVDSSVRAQQKTLGTFWSTTVGDSTHMILISEKLTSSGLAGGWVTEEPFGYAGQTPGERFGVGVGIPPERLGPWGLVHSELAYARHRSNNSPGTGTQPVGRITIGYADGHVDMKSNDELASAVTGLSTLDSEWSPWDPQINH